MIYNSRTLALTLKMSRVRAAQFVGVQGLCASSSCVLALHSFKNLYCMVDSLREESAKDTAESVLVTFELLGTPPSIRTRGKRARVKC